MKLQRGFVALLMMVLVAVGVFGAMAAWVASEPPPSVQSINRAVLAQAKEALLAYVVETALSGKNTRLPCPNITGDGKADVDPIPAGASKPCGLAGNIQLGLLPWSALSLPPLRDAYGECLWYAVSGDFKYAIDPATGLILKDKVNADTDGSITVKDEAGYVLADKVVAVVFARSARIGLQTPGASASASPCSTTPIGDAAQDAAGYLGSRNANPAANPVATADFSHATQLAPDKVSLTHQLIWITADEFAAVAMRANAEVLNAALTSLLSTTKGRLPLAANVPGGTCITGQYSGFYPASCNYPNPDPGAAPGSMLIFNNLSATLLADEWHRLAFYAVDPDCAFDMPMAAAAPNCSPSTKLSASGRSVRGAILARGRKLPGAGHDCGAGSANEATQSLTCIETPANNQTFDTTVTSPIKSLVEPDPTLPSNDILKVLP